MNNCTFIGRLTRDVELKYTGSGMAVAEFNLAVNRRFTNSNGERDADFIRIRAWRNAAEAIAKWTKKGSQLAVKTRCETGQYEKDGVTHYTTTFVVEEFDFLDSKKSQENRQSAYQGGYAGPGSYPAAEQVPNGVYSSAPDEHFGGAF
jgi:single-stranded DNA-binding protein